MMEFVNGKDDIPYMKWKNNPNVWNHQPDNISIHRVRLEISTPQLFRSIHDFGDPNWLVRFT